MDLVELRFEVFACYREVHHLQRKIDALLARAAKAAESADKLEAGQMPISNGLASETGRYSYHRRQQSR